MDTITAFRGPHAFLSNFHVESDGLTAEHRFQAAKTRDPDEAAAILAAPKPGGAKRLGRRCTLRPDWDQVKLSVMTEVVRHKFRDPDLRAQLEATGDAQLEEGNSWNDTYWGVSLRTGRGQNHLGRILMQVRDENREQS